MTYEFHAGDSIANDVPNPFKVENLFLALSSIALVAGAISVLLAARAYFQSNEVKLAGVTVMLAVVLFGAATKFLIQALSHIRFYMGIKQPRGLAQELKPTTFGLGNGARGLISTLRDGAIEFPEPKGALNGLLYTLIKPLITSPPPIQVAAVQHFHSLVAMSAILISMIVSYVCVAGSPYEGVVSWFYLPMTGLSILTPFLKKDVEDVSASKVGDSNKMVVTLFGLVVFSMIGPVAIPHYMPAYPIPPMWIAPTLMLAASMVASAMFLASLFSQLDNVEQTSVSCEQTTISMNCHPAQLWTKVSRDFQSQWVRNTPNRAYANVPPGATESDRGSFQGYILEETQPTPFNNMAIGSLSEAFGARHVRWLTALNVWGLLVSVASALTAAAYAPQLGSMAKMEITRAVLVTVALTAAAALAFRISHLLWSRMYFKSRLVCIVVDGTFQDAELSIGNQFTGSVQSRSTLTRVEDATLRVWVTDIVSVAFGKEAKRFIMAMAPADSVAKSTADGLKEFALSQSSVTTPTNHRDIERAKAVVAMDKAIGGADASALDAFAQKQSISMQRG